MSNPERSVSMVQSSRSLDARVESLAASEELAPETKRARLVAVPAHNPFASLAPSPSAGREANAETKLYEVPRELIEIARARSADAEAAGTTTPLAPRPDAELEAALWEYSARVSSAPAGVSPALLELASATSPIDAPSGDGRTSDGRTSEGRTSDDQIGELEAAPLTLSTRRIGPRRPSRLRDAPLPRGAQAPSSSRAWMVYAALSLMGLASCAHVLLGS